MEVVQLRREAGTAILTLNRPAQRNALDTAMRHALAAAVAQVRDDASVRAVVPCVQSEFHREAARRFAGEGGAAV